MDIDNINEIDRIPDAKTLDSFIEKLESYYKEVLRAVNFEFLSEEVGHKIIQYFVQTYPPFIKSESREDKINIALQVPNNGPIYDEIGYWIIKKDIEKRLKIDDLSLLLDATMGWLRYSPDGYHNTKQLEQAREYMQLHGVQNFKDGVDMIEKEFTNLQDLLKPCAKSGVVAVASGFNMTLGYSDFFRQSSPSVSSSKRFVYRELNLN